MVALPELSTTMHVAAFGLMAVAIVVQAWRTRPGLPEIGVGLGLVSLFVMVIVRTGIPEERTHLFEYSLVGALIYQALLERQGNGRRVAAPAVLAVVATALIGWLDEGVQAMMPSRVYDLRDVGFNALAGVMAVGGTRALAWARDRR